MSDEYGKFIFLSNDAEESLKNARDAEINAIACIQAENIRETQMKINEEIDRKSEKDRKELE